MYTQYNTIYANIIRYTLYMMHTLYYVYTYTIHCIYIYYTLYIHILYIIVTSAEPIRFSQRSSSSRCLLVLRDVTKRSHSPADAHSQLQHKEEDWHTKQ